MPGRPILHEVKDFPQPIPETRVCLSFNHLQFTELAVKIKSDNEELRENALTLLIKYLNVPIQVADATQCGIIPVLDHSSPKTRYKGSECFKLISAASCGRISLMQSPEILQSVLSHIDDVVTQVKVNCYETLINVSSVEEGCLYIYKLHFLPKILESFEKESIKFQILALNVIRNTQKLHTNESTIELLEYNFIYILLKHIDVDNNNFQLIIWDNLKWLTYCNDGKVNAHKLDLLSYCFSKINYNNYELTNEILQCLTNILVLTECKRQINKDNVILYTDILSQGLTHNNENIKLYSIKALTNAVVHPKVREILLNNDTIKKLNTIYSDVDNEGIKTSINVLKEQIRWKP